MVLLVVALLAASCGPPAGQEVDEMDVDDARARVEEVVGGVLDAAVGDRERTPGQGSGKSGPPCDPDGPVTRRLSVSMIAGLEDSDDVTAMITRAADYFTAQGLTVGDVRTEPPQLGAYAADESGAPYSLRVVPDAARIIAGGNTACLPEDGDSAAASPPVAAAIASVQEMTAFLDATAAAVAPDVAVGHVPAECTAGQVVQHTIDPRDAVQAEAIFDAVGEHWDTHGTVERDGADSGTRTLVLQQDPFHYEAILVAGSFQVILAAGNGCDE